MRRSGSPPSLRASPRNAVEGAASFDVTWLRLREPADASARAEHLATEFARALADKAGPGDPLRITDLGCGTGANMRYLAPRIAAVAERHQHWRFVDGDRALLAAAPGESEAWATAQGWRIERSGAAWRIAAGGGELVVEPLLAELAAGPGSIQLRRGEGVGIAALLDLVSVEWVDRLVDWLAAVGAPVLAVLNFDGRLTWTPSDPDDGLMAALFGAHQRRDKGFGPALGATAAACLVDRLAASGYRTVRASSDWRLDEWHLDLQAKLVATVAGAAAEQEPGAGKIAQRWRARREMQVGEGLLRIIVGHEDVCGVPCGVTPAPP